MDEDLGLECGGESGPYLTWELSLNFSQAGDIVRIKVSDNITSLTITGANIAESISGSTSSPYTIYNLTPDKEYVLIYTSICGPTSAWVLTNPNPKYKVYTALLSQTGTDDPVAIELENTIGAIQFDKLGIGRYEINAVDGALFTENKTTFFAMPFTEGDINSQWQTNIAWIDNVTLHLETYMVVGGVPTYQDFGTSKQPIEIRVYN